MPYSRPVAEEIVSAITATSGGPKGRGALGQCPKPGAQQLALHAQLADPLQGGSKLAGGRVGLGPGQGPGPFSAPCSAASACRPAPLLEPEDRQAELTGEELRGPPAP